LNLNGVSFLWRTDEFPDKKFKTGRDIGVVAQNVETQFPEVVETGLDGFKSVAYQKLIAPLIEAIKELFAKWSDDHVRLARLEEENRLKSQEISELKLRLENLERSAAALPNRQTTR
jgi:superfamily I DNA and/or RNA helicase